MAIEGPSPRILGSNTAANQLPNISYFRGCDRL